LRISEDQLVDTLAGQVFSQNSNKIKGFIDIADSEKVFYEEIGHT
jgi:hypothetical protein